MKHTMSNLTKCLSAGVLLSAMLGGCTTEKLADENHHDTTVETAPIKDPDTGSKKNSWGYYSPRLGANEAATSMAFPTGDPKTSALLLHQVTPKQVRRGEDFDFSYHVTNLTNANLQNVLVSMTSASNIAVSSSEPAASRSAGGMSWAMGDFGPGETKLINIKGHADKVGTAGDCISVSYNNYLCATLQVVEPALALTKTATASALKCDPIILRYVVKNTGTGCADNVVIKDTLPTGLTLADGSRNVNIPVGQLCEGESKAYEVKAEANGRGTFESPAVATADGGMSANASKTTTVITEPVLAMTAKCSDARYLGRNMTYNYTMTNTGNGAAASSTASASIPAGTTLVSASNGGQVSGSNVVWNLGDIAPGATREFSMVVRAAVAGDYVSTVNGNASCAATASDRCSTPVEGIPAILLEVVDIEDPIEVGSNTTYVITVTNQGTAPDRNIRVVCDLPGQESFVSGTGSTAVSASGQKVSFAPVPVLAPGAQVSWRIIIKANAAGDVRFATEMTSDQLTSPVNETEATRLYE
ncbi:MAG: DUF11 domain-containing protein [Phycisphaerales bacterium]|nr:DUF11 domain-containing protein [Phycisphaerales bacterium]